MTTLVVSALEIQKGFSEGIHGPLFLAPVIHAQTGDRLHSV